MDFIAYKVKTYESVRAALAGIYHDSTLFSDPFPLISYPFLRRSNQSLDENKMQEREEWEKQRKNETEQRE